MPTIEAPAMLEPANTWLEDYVSPGLGADDVSSTSQGLGAGALGAFAGVGAAVGALGQIASSIAQARAMAAQSEYQQQVFEMSARLADRQADNAIMRGEFAATEVTRRGRQLQSQQRVGSAAQQVDVSTGSAAVAQADTRYFTELDALTIRNNAWREAWGLRFAATDYRGRSAMSALASNYQQTTTLLSGVQRASSGLLSAGYMVGRSV